MKRQFKMQKGGSKDLLTSLLEANISKFIGSQIKGLGEFDPKLRDDYTTTVLVEGTKQRKYQNQKRGGLEFRQCTKCRCMKNIRENMVICKRCEDEKQKEWTNKDIAEKLVKAGVVIMPTNKKRGVR